MKIFHKKSSGSITKNIALIMSLVMMVTLMPWGMFGSSTVEAADLVTIDYPGGKGQSAATAIEISDNLFTFTGSYASGQVSDLSYTITNLGSGYTSAGGTPESAGTNLYRYRNVALTPGVNQITVKHTTGYNISIFVRFNDMPAIYNLKINNKDLSSNELVINETILPGRALSGNINGYASNATNVEITNESLIGTDANARIAAQVFGATGMFSGTIPLRAGENMIKFVARNETKSVVETRRVIVNALTAGSSLNAYNVQAQYGTVAAGTLKNVPKSEEVDFFVAPAQSDAKLYNDSYVPTTVANELQFLGRLIVNMGANTYRELGDPAENGEVSSISYDLRNKSGLTIISGPAIMTKDTDIWLDTAESIGTTRYYDFRTPVIPADAKALFTNGEKYTLVLIPNFVSAAGGRLTYNPLEYDFIYNDSTYPRITSFQNHDTNEVIYAESDYRISKETFNLRVNFDNITEIEDHATTGIKLRYKAQPYPAILHTQPPGGYDKEITPKEVNAPEGYAVFELKGLLPGNNKIEVNYKKPGVTNPVEYKQMIALITTTPLITITDGTSSEIVNDKVYEFRVSPNSAETEEDFVTKFFNKVTFSFKGVSDQKPLGKNDGSNNIQISFNDKPLVTGGINIGTATGPAEIITNITPGAAPITTVEANFMNMAITPVDAIKDNFRQGLNTIDVRFKNGNNDARVTIQFYLFTENAPEVSDIKVEAPANSNRVEAIVGYQPFETDANDVTITGKIKEADTFIVRIQGVEVARYEYRDIASGWVAIRDDINVTFNNVAANSADFKIDKYPLMNPSENVLQGTFEFAFEVQRNHTSMTYPLTITKKVEPYTVLAPYRSVVNNNFQKVIIRSDSAVSVTIGKEEALKINLADRNSDVMAGYIGDWLESHLYGSNKALYDNLGTDGKVFFAEVALKKGQNKIPITVNFGSQQVSGDIPVYYAASAQAGAVFKTDMIKSNKIKVADWGNAIELNFPKGTLLQKKDLNIYGEYADSDKYYEIPNFWADKQILIGIADKETGKVDRDIKKATSLDLQLSLNNTYYNSFFQYSSPLFFIDAGDLGHPGGRLPYESPMIYQRNDDNALEPTQRGTITLAFDSSIVMDAGPHLAVMYNPGYGSIGNATGWQNLGGTVNTKNNTITVPFEGFGYYTVMKLNRSLADIIYHPWGRRNLEAMFSKGIMITEPGTNRFGTDLNITRGEFVTMLVKALNIPINAGPYTRQGLVLMPVNSSFDDIRPGMGDYFWQHEYLETAARAGIIQGMQPGLFMPNEQLTREQAAVLIARATEAKLARTPEIAMTQLTKSFTDASSVEYYALQAVAAINQTGIVVGKQNDPNDVSRGFSFLPKNNLTRAEASTIAVRLMQKQKLLPDPL